MSAAELTPPEAARWAARAGLPLPADRHAAVAYTATPRRERVPTGEPHLRADPARPRARANTRDGGSL